MRIHFKFAAYLFAAISFCSQAATPDVEFFRAVNVDDDRTVRSLLASGLDPNITNPQGQTGLVLAMKDDSPKVAAALLAHPGIQVDAATSADETALMMAAMRGRLDWVQKLAERGAALSRAGWAPLHYACSGPEGLDVARYLLDQGVAIDARSPNGTTPLMMAARYGSNDATELLLKRGANANLRNDRDLQATDFARLGGREPLAVRLAQLAAP
jgi:ankyrin repeat protein